MGPLLAALLRPGSKLLLSGARRYSNNSAPIINPNVTIEEIMPLLNTKFRKTTPISVDAAEDVLETLKAGFPLGRTKGLAEKDALYNVAKKFHPKSNVTNPDVTIILKALTDKTKKPAEFPLFNAIKKEVPGFKSTMSEKELALYLKNYDKPLRELEKITGRNKVTLQAINNVVQPGGVVNLNLKNKLEKIVGTNVDFNKYTNTQVLKKKYKGDVNASNTAASYQIPKRTELLDESINTSNKVLTAAKKTFPKDLIQKEDFIGPIQKSRTVRGHGMGQEFFSKNLTTMSDKQVKKMFNLNSKDYTAIKDFTLAKENSGAYLRAAQKIKDNPSLANKINAIEKMRDPQFITSSTQNALHRKIEPRLNEAYFKKQTANKKGNFNFSNKLQTEIETYDAILKEARIPSFVWDDAAGQLKYYGAFPESTSKFANLAKGIQGTTPKGFFNNPKFKEGGRVQLKDGGNVEKADVDNVFRQYLDLGGLAGGSKGSNLGRVSVGSLGGIKQRSDDKVGTIQSLLSGIAAGLIDIPKGAFTLGASLMDLGMGTNNAARVESYFDDLTTFDEKAEATTAGSLARIFTNLGIPGSQGWKLGSSLAKKAVTSKRAGNYFKVSRPDMEGRMQEALTTGGKLLTTAGGAAGIGVADAIFVGDPESVGTLGDAFSVGPTQLDPNSDTDPSREILNRIKFGLDSSLMLGVIGGTGAALGKVIARNKGLESNNKTLDKLFSYLRPRGDKPQEFFNLERQQLGIRQADLGRAQELQRNVDRHIDKIFPFVKGALNRTKPNDRPELMKQLNETLLSGELIDDVAGGLKFTPIDNASRTKSLDKLKSLGAGQKEIDGIFNAFEDMRTEWGDMFGYLGKKMSAKDLKGFKGAFGKKFSDYLGSTYEVFKNKSLIPMFNFTPGREAIKKAMNMFKDSHAKSKGMTLKEAEAKGLALTDEQAEYYVNEVVRTADTPKQVATTANKNLGLYFDVPDFFVNKTTLKEVDDALKFSPKGLPLSRLESGPKGVIEELLGKVDDPMSTMLAGTGKLSLLTRRNQFFDKILEESNLATEMIKDAAGKMVPKYPDKKRMFFETQEEAVTALGRDNVKIVEFDPSGKLKIGNTINSLQGMYAHKGIANALAETSTNILGDNMLSKLYTNLVLYPKATSQLAKTVLSPVTHFRNLVSAGAFATANGIFFPIEGKAMKEAYKVLQFGARDDAAANAVYQKLLKLGVVNTNVRLGDLQKLLTDVKFGEAASNMTAVRGMMKKLSKLKKGAEDLYTAEDDFWKITSWAVERNRYDKAFRKAGLTDLDAYAKTKGFNKYGDFLDETAADIVRNNIPNYDYVNEFVKGLRKLPMGNFVSFPAEIMRTSANILSRGFKEISEQITLPDGRKVKPFSSIGYKRLIGFGATTVAVPAAITESFKTIYNVGEDEMDALRRFVPDWSKNSTLVPIRDKETGNLKYVDFSHANAYDTMVRPFVTMLNNVRDGNKDEAPVMESLMRGMFEATKELGSPFISESIWTQAATDIIFRKGRTPTGQRLYTEQTPVGEKIQKIVAHLVEAQTPGSVDFFKRLDLAIEPIDIIQKGKFDKYGKAYELGDELAGLVGLRAVDVDPVNAMKFKIANFRTGVNNARREFTQPLLKGGPVTPEQIIDRYQVANEQTYKVQQNMLKDYYAARVLGTGETTLDREFKDRVSNIQLNAIKTGRFRPFIPSENIVKSFAENASAIGQRSPYLAAQREIERLLQQYNALPLTLEQFPISINPFSVEPEMPTAGMNLTGGTLPKLNTTLQGSNIGGINNLGTTLAKLEQVDKVFDL